MVFDGWGEGVCWQLTRTVGSHLTYCICCTTSQSLSEATLSAICIDRGQSYAGRGGLESKVGFKISSRSD
jgi:hypothetical protein